AGMCVPYPGRIAAPGDRARTVRAERRTAGAAQRQRWAGPAAPGCVPHARGSVLLELIDEHQQAVAPPCRIAGERRRQPVRPPLAGAHGGNRERPAEPGRTSGEDRQNTGLHERRLAGARWPDHVDLPLAAIEPSDQVLDLRTASEEVACLVLGEWTHAG